MLIEHFLNDLVMMAGSIESQAVFTHCVTTDNDGHFRLPAAVHLKEPDNIQADHSSQSLYLNGWLMDSSSGCRIDDGDICVEAVGSMLFHFIGEMSTELVPDN